MPAAALVPSSCKVQAPGDLSASGDVYPTCRQLVCVAAVCAADCVQRAAVCCSLCTAVGCLHPASAALICARLLPHRTPHCLPFATAPCCRAYEEALATGMHRLLGHLLSEASHAFWRSSAYLLQLLDTVAVVSRGSLVSLEVMGPQTLAAHKLPHNVSVSPLAVVAGEAASLTLTGSHISAADASLVVKGGGRLLHLAGVGATHSSSRGCCGSKPAGNAAAEGCAAAGCGHGQQQGEEAVGCSLAVPGGVPGQVLWVEVARGAFLSQPRPVLVVADPLLAQVGAAGSVAQGVCAAALGGGTFGAVFFLGSGRMKVRVGTLAPRLAAPSPLPSSPRLFASLASDTSSLPSLV